MSKEEVAKILQERLQEVIDRKFDKNAHIVIFVLHDDEDSESPLGIHLHGVVKFKDKDGRIHACTALNNVGFLLSWEDITLCESIAGSWKKYTKCFLHDTEQANGKKRYQLKDCISNHTVEELEELLYGTRRKAKHPPHRDKNAAEIYLDDLREALSNCEMIYEASGDMARAKRVFKKAERQAEADYKSAVKNICSQQEQEK